MSRFLKSFGFAFAGIREFFRTERNGRIMGLIAVVVIIAGFLFRISSAEWTIISFCIALVIGMEMVNSSVEKLCDLITTGRRPEIKQIKDIAAGAVLWVSIFAAAAGAIVFLPYILKLFYAQ